MPLSIASLVRVGTATRAAVHTRPARTPRATQRRCSLIALEMSRQPARESAILREVTKRGDAIVIWLLRQAEDPLADDVVLDLVGPAVDGRALREQRELGHDAGQRP